MKVYVLYENPAWLPPLVRELDQAELPYELWFINEGHFDLRQAPPDGVYLNRISPSSHTRDHLSSVGHAWELLAWLEGHGRRVVNGSRAFSLEISKVRQYEALRQAGIAVPHTIAVAGGHPALKRAARAMPTPFITKHNRGGKGLGVRLFRNGNEFDRYVDSADFSPPVDGITLLQEYVESAEPYITRVEIVNGEFLYALRSNTSRGFELCPADGCQPAENVDPQSVFSLREGFDDPVIEQYIRFMEGNGIDLAGIEFIEDQGGNKLTYDVNGTTNYSPAVEQATGVNGMKTVVQLLARELKAPPVSVSKGLAGESKRLSVESAPQIR